MADESAANMPREGGFAEYSRLREAGTALRGPAGRVNLPLRIM